MSLCFGAHFPTSGQSDLPAFVLTANFSRLMSWHPLCDPEARRATVSRYLLNLQNPKAMRIHHYYTSLARVHTFFFPKFTFKFPLILFLPATQTCPVLHKPYYCELSLCNRTFRAAETAEYWVQKQTICNFYVQILCKKKKKGSILHFVAHPVGKQTHLTIP